MKPAALTLPVLNQRLFWSHVDRSAGPDACWPWTKNTTKGGYGRFRVGKRRGEGDRLMLAHVVAFLLAGGVLTDEQPNVLHHCDNPPCCNPRCLFAGSQAENMLDMKLKKRRRRETCPQGHPYSGANLFISADGHRRCRACMAGWGKVVA